MNNTLQHAEIAACAKQESAASEIFKGLAILADRAHELADRTANILAPIMLEAKPCPSEVEQKLRDLPPYFAQLRVQLIQIAGSLDRIEATLTRVEL